MDHEAIMRRWCLATTIADYKLRRCMKCLPKKRKAGKRKLLNRSSRKKQKTQRNQWDLRPGTSWDARKEIHNGRAWMFEKQHGKDIGSFYLRYCFKNKITATEITCLYLPPYGYLCMFSMNRMPISIDKLLTLAKIIDRGLVRVYRYLAISSVESGQLANNNEPPQGEYSGGGSNHHNEQVNGKQGNSLGGPNREASKAINASRNSKSAYYLSGRRNVLDSLVARQYGCHMRLEDMTKVVDKVVPGVIGVEPIVRT